MDTYYYYFEVTNVETPYHVIRCPICNRIEWRETPTNWVIHCKNCGYIATFASPIYKGRES